MDHRSDTTSFQLDQESWEVQLMACPWPLCRTAWVPLLTSPSGLKSPLYLCGGTLIVGMKALLLNTSWTTTRMSRPNRMLLLLRYSRPLPEGLGWFMTSPRDSFSQCNGAPSPIKEILRIWMKDLTRPYEQIHQFIPYGIWQRSLCQPYLPAT